MAELEQLPKRLDTLERKLDALSASVDRRFDEVDKRFDDVYRRFDEIDKRFDEVSEHFVEQRQYTEFAFARLEARMNEGFVRLGSQVDANTEGLARLERKLDQFIDSQLRPETTLKARRPRRR
jgi:hypothetical protein